MSDLRDRFNRILKQRNLTMPSPQALAMLDAIEECLDADRQQVASNWQSHVRLDRRVTTLEKDDIA